MHFSSVFASVLLSLGLVSAVSAQYTDYVLYEGPGLKITSSFDRPGKPWCEHVYVIALAEYDGADEDRAAKFAPDYESFLQAKIVPKIQNICENFPNAAKYFPQSLRLQFKRAGDLNLLGHIGYKIGPDGTLSMRADARRVRPAPTEDEIAAFTEGVYRIEDDFLVTTFGVWRKTAKVGMCKTTHVPNTAAQLNSLTDKQFESLAGDYSVVGIADVSYIYVREQRKWFRSRHPDESEFNIDDYKRNGNLYDLPIVCVVGNISVVGDVNARLAEHPIIEPPSLFKGKTGGEYLTAIYIGDFERQSTLARRYLNIMSNGLSGAMAHLMGGLAQTAGNARIAKQELTVLEEVLAAYMSQYSRNGESCLTDGWFERKFTYKLPDDVYFDEYGIETGRIDGGTRTTIYKLNKEFAEACDNLCSTGGALTLSSMTETKMSRNKEDTLGSVFFGVIQILENSDCSNPEVKQFEKSLLAMYEKERAVPSRDRNTLQNILFPNK